MYDVVDVTTSLVCDYVCVVVADFFTIEGGGRRELWMLGCGGDGGCRLSVGGLGGGGGRRGESRGVGGGLKVSRRHVVWRGVWGRGGRAGTGGVLGRLVDVAGRGVV